MDSWLIYSIIPRLPVSPVQHAGKGTFQHQVARAECAQYGQGRWDRWVNTAASSTGTCHLPPALSHTAGGRGAKWDAELQMRAECLVLQAAEMNNGARNRHG